MRPARELARDRGPAIKTALTGVANALFGLKERPMAGCRRSVLSIKNINRVGLFQPTSERNRRPLFHDHACHYVSDIGTEPAEVDQASAHERNHGVGVGGRFGRNREPLIDVRRHLQLRAR